MKKYSLTTTLVLLFLGIIAFSAAAAANNNNGEDACLVCNDAFLNNQNHNYSSSSSSNSDDCVAALRMNTSFPKEGTQECQRLRDACHCLPIEQRACSLCHDDETTDGIDLEWQNDKDLLSWVDGITTSSSLCDKLQLYARTIPKNTNNNNTWNDNNDNDDDNTACLCKAIQEKIKQQQCDINTNHSGGGDDGDDCNQEVVILRGPGDLSIAQNKALAWGPRTSAILSFLSSSFIVQDIVLHGRYKGSIYHQLVLGMSVFDCVSSAAISLTTLPMPSNVANKVGSRGNDATCKAQGFFLQLGISSLLYNISLSIYYLLVITFGWKDYKLEKAKRWLHGVPLFVGPTMAFAAIPYYGPSLFLCYMDVPTANSSNSNAWGTITPIFFGIGYAMCALVVATISQCLVYCKVRKQYRASQRWRMNSSTNHNNNTTTTTATTATAAHQGHRRSINIIRRSSSSNSSISNKVERQVAKQAFLYLLGFYLCWPFMIYASFSVPYTTAFWATIIADIMFPMQGVFNLIVYSHRRYERARSLRHQEHQQQQHQQQRHCYSSGHRCLSSGPRAATSIESKTKSAASSSSCTTRNLHPNDAGDDGGANVKQQQQQEETLEEAEYMEGEQQDTEQQHNNNNNVFGMAHNSNRDGWTKHQEEDSNATNLNTTSEMIRPIVVVPYEYTTTTTVEETFQAEVDDHLA